MSFNAIDKQQNIAYAKNNNWSNTLQGQMDLCFPHERKRMDLQKYETQ